MAAAALAELGISLGPTDDLFLSPPTLPTSLNPSKSSTPTTDLYSYLKHLEREHEFVVIQAEYIKDEQKNLKKEWQRAKEEVKRIQSVPLVIGQFLEIIDLNTGIVTATTGQTYYVRILSTINREQLKPNSSVALHRYSNSVVDVLPPEADSAISMMQMQEKPDVAYTDIGGLDIQKQEIREAVELPLTHFELYRQIGIDPPRGVLLWGPPGTGTPLRLWHTVLNPPLCCAAAHPLCVALCWAAVLVGREDDDGQGCGSPHDGELHPRGGQRVRAEVPGRGAKDGEGRLQDGARERPGHHLHRQHPQQQQQPHSRRHTNSPSILIA